MPERAALVAVLIMERPLCMGCICDKSGLNAGKVEAYLITLAATLVIQRGVNRCRACGMSTAVFSLFRRD